jgi:hypothetical protein
MHPTWLEGASPTSRTWDLHLSYFGDRTNPYADRPDDVTLSFEKGTPRDVYSLPSPSSWPALNNGN